MGRLRKNIMLGTAGHVDHGKTALVKLLTGCETDTLAEEKQRGLTIDLGFAPCRLADDRIVGVVDVPGHIDFIRNMVAGAHGIDVVIFVVAADDGIMPQTYEHLHILTLAGLKHGLVALTKIDLVEPSRRDIVIQQLRQLLTGTFLAQAPICPISNITGEGFEGFFDSLNDVVKSCEDRPCSGLFRMWVEDVFTIRGQGTVITGIPTHGSVRVGDSLQLLPAGTLGRVRQLQVYGEDAAEGRAGECVAINLPELDHLSVKRGMVLGVPDTFSAVTMAEAELRVLDSLKGKVEDYPEVHLHVGTASVLARVAMLETTQMTAGQTQMVQLRFTEPLVLIPGERFVVRSNLAAQGQSGLTTIGGGRILAASNVRLRRQKQWSIDLLRARRKALDNPKSWCELMLRETAQPIASAELQKKCLLGSDEFAKELRELQTSGTAVATASGLLVHKCSIDRAATKMLETVEQFHKANSQRAGFDQSELFVAAGTNPEICALAVQSLVSTRKLECAGTVYSRFGWSTRLSDRDQRLYDAISAAYQRAGFTGPTAPELVTALVQPLDRIEKMLKLLTERAVLVRLDAQLLIHRDALEAAKKITLQLFVNRPLFTTMDFRDALGVSRKYAVPLLDYFDRIRFTVRNGNNRTPGVEARKLLG